MPQPRLDWTEAAFEFSFKLTSVIGVISWRPKNTWDRWEGKTVHNLVDVGWHDDRRLVLTTDNTSKIVRHH